MPENEELPNSPNFTVPAISPALTLPMNSRVIGIGSVLDTFQEITPTSSALPTLGPEWNSLRTSFREFDFKNSPQSAPLSGVGRPLKLEQSFLSVFLGHFNSLEDCRIDN
jgi:hypothetical protein